MTREQAKREIDSLDYYLQNHTDDYGEESHTAMMMAIKALEQEPCEDAISREEAIDACNQSVNILEATDRIKDLPPVTPQEPFMNKPCVAHQVCHEEKVKILDKIRAEIISNLEIMNICNVQKSNGVVIHSELSNRKVVLVDSVIEIIDKYKSEREDKKNECI